MFSLDVESTVSRLIVSGEAYIAAGVTENSEDKRKYVDLIELMK